MSTFSQKFATYSLNILSKQISVECFRGMADVRTFEASSFFPYIPIDNLLDICRNMDQMIGRDKIFYKDQQSSRECCLCEEVDEEFEKEKQAQFEEEIEIEEQFILESIFMNDEVTVQVTL